MEYVNSCKFMSEYDKADGDEHMYIHVVLRAASCPFIFQTLFLFKAPTGIERLAEKTMRRRACLAISIAISQPLWVVVRRGCFSSAIAALTAFPINLFIFAIAWNS